MSFKLVRNIEGFTHENISTLKNLYNKTKNKTLKLFISILITRWRSDHFGGWMRSFGPVIMHAGRYGSCHYKIFINRRDLSSLIIINSTKKTLILKKVSLFKVNSKNSENFYKELKKLKGYI